MAIQRISIDRILIEKSCFSLMGILFEPDTDEDCPSESFKNLGILNPVIVYEDREVQFHIIDGKKRIHYAKQNQIEMINAIVLSETVPTTDIIILILCNKKNEIELSIINKVQFICFVLSLGVTESWILGTLCVPFGFKPHSEFLRDCKHMNNLPKELKKFCHEKKFSLKQILNLTYHPEALLLQLTKWDSELQLTASVLDEIASNLKDYLKSHNKTVEDFLSEPEVHEIMQSSLSPRDKTEKLRRLIHMKRFPILSETNARIQETIEGLNLPNAIYIDWDTTLENKNVDIAVHLHEPEKWKELLNTLNSADMKKAIRTILDEL